MTRSQKFSFPLPSRKSSSRVPPPVVPQVLSGEQNIWRGGEEKNSKAHQVLGTSDINSVKTDTSKRWRMKRSVTTKPSFVSITVSEVSQAKSEVKVKQEVKHNARNYSPPRKVHTFDRDLHARPSSPLLGERFQNASNLSDASSNFRSRQLHQFDSTSSLHSFYDPAKSPLAVSQQTSESSARDYALRKGCPPVNGLHAHPPAEFDGRHHNSAKPQEETQPKPLRRRRPRIDLSMLFPKPKASGGPLLSPQRLTSSPSLMSEASAPPLPRLNSSHMGSDTSTANSRKASLAAERLREQVLPFEIQSSRVPKRRPQPTLAMKHWFDTFEEVHSDDEIPDDSQSLAVSGPVLAQLEHRHSRNISEDTIRPRTPPGLLSMPRKSVQTTQARSPASAQSSHVQSSLLSWDDAVSNPSLVSRPSATSRKTSGSAMSSADLHEESVLCLSSSSDDEDHGPTFTLPPKSAKKSQRESVATSTYSDVVEICKAEAVSSARSRSSKIQSSRTKSSSKAKRSIPQRSSSAAIPAALNIPALRELRSTSSPHSGSFKSAEAQPKPPIPERDERRLSILPVTSYNPSSEYGLTKTTKRQSRIMAVTQEEESLLELMRQKRASMRQSLFVEGYMSAMDEEVKIELGHRPRTSHNESESSFLRLREDRASMSTRPRTSSEHRASLQAGDFVFPGPPLPKSIFRDSRQGSIQSGRSTRESLSLGFSDALPSPSTSRASPITPTTARSAQSTRGRFSKELSIPQSSSPTDQAPERGHSRTRTHSSGVIVLDGVDGGSRETSVLIEEGWPVWAVRGWGDRTSVAVV